MSINPNVIDAQATVSQSVEIPQPHKLELEITKEQPGILEWKFDELNNALDYELARYKDAKITADNFTEAKKVRADLNALSKAINDKKIAVKKTFNAPYIEFEDKVKVLLNKIKSVTEPIDTGIKALEESEKKAKRNEIIGYFMENIQYLEEPFASNLLFDYVYDPRWLNKSCSKTKWQQEINDAVKAIYSTYKSIESMYPGDEQKINEIKGIFCSTGKFNLDDTLRAYTVMQQAKQQAAQPKPVQKAAPDPIIQPTPVTGNIPMPQPVVEPKEEPEEMIELSFMVRATKHQINALAAFMNEAGIKFKQL